MASSKTREKKPTHQAMKASEVAKSKRRKVNWTEVALIIIGLIVVASMVLSLVHF